MPITWAKRLGALALSAAAVTTTAAVAADPPKEMKLYVFTSGALNLDKSIIQNGASGKVTIPVASGFNATAGSLVPNSITIQPVTKKGRRRCICSQVV